MSLYSHTPPRVDHPFYGLNPGLFAQGAFFFNLLFKCARRDLNIYYSKKSLPLHQVSEIMMRIERNVFIALNRIHLHSLCYKRFCNNLL